MDSIFWLEALTVSGCWVVAGYTIWKWGPGLRNRSVQCPEKNLPARVMAQQREAEFGCIRVTDVKTCSLFPGTGLACNKACVARL